MNSDSYWYKGYRISRTNHDANRWGVWYKERLLCDTYGSPEEAALAANKKDFDIVDAIDLCGGIYAPSEINMWQTTPPQIPAIPLPGTSTTSCKGRSRKTNSTRLNYD